VKRLRLSRNKKTGKSKHFAFLEFEHAEVAAIVAQTHNNMLMCDRAIKCAVVPKSQHHEKMWRGADEKFVPHNFKFAAKEAANGKRTAAQEAARIKNLVKKEKGKRKKLESLGIELDFKGYEGLTSESKPKRIKFTE
jgi:nucleolar protein 15